MRYGPFLIEGGDDSLFMVAGMQPDRAVEADQDAQSAAAFRKYFSGTTESENSHAEHFSVIAECVELTLIPEQTHRTRIKRE